MNARGHSTQVPDKGLDEGSAGDILDSHLGILLYFIPPCPPLKLIVILYCPPMYSNPGGRPGEEVG